MKKNILVILLIIPFLSFSQINITGKVKDSINNIEFANVILTSVNNNIVSGSITNENGLFTIKSKKGKYNVTISFIGYKDWVKDIIITKSMDLGVITLVESNSKLDEVVITVKKKLIERKVDRLVFNVEQSISASGGNAIDALKVTPRVRVQNDAISIIGKIEMRVLVNDRLIQLTGGDLTNFFKKYKV